MPAQIPCLWFDGDAQAAADLYTSVFPRSRITKVTHWGPNQPGEEGSVLTVEFELDGQPYLALNGGPEYSFTPAVSFQVFCADQEEVDHYWDRLTDGGKEVACGWLTDRFGLSWQITPTRLPELLQDPDPGRAQRAMQAMMQMVKIDIAGLERAADGG